MISRLPEWFRQEIPSQDVFPQLGLLSSLGLHTVCQEAHCPNLSSCFSSNKLTFLILGNTCTRKCRFCAVDKTVAGKLPLDLEEPARLAAAVRQLELKYVVITSVTRDDLADGGSGIFAQAINLLRALGQGIKIEVLIPDLQGKVGSLKTITDAMPDILAHNLETVPRLYPDLRPQANYETSLGILKKAKLLKPNITTKSSLMLGLGERQEEVVAVMRDLRYNQCDILSLGQYLSPSLKHYPVKEFILPEQFRRYKEVALGLRFKAVVSAPLARSSYQAEEAYANI